MDELEEDVKCPSEDKGEEEAEAGEVRVALRAVQVRRPHAARTVAGALELAGGNVRLGTDVRRARQLLGGLCFCHYAPHALHGVDEEDGNETADTCKQDARGGTGRVQESVF